MEDFDINVEKYYILLNEQEQISSLNNSLERLNYKGKSNLLDKVFTKILNNAKELPLAALKLAVYWTKKTNASIHECMLYAYEEEKKWRTM